MKHSGKFLAALFASVAAGLIGIAGETAYGYDHEGSSRRIADSGAAREPARLVVGRDIVAPGKSDNLLRANARADYRPQSCPGISCEFEAPIIGYRHVCRSNPGVEVCEFECGLDGACLGSPCEESLDVSCHIIPEFGELYCSCDGVPAWEWCCLPPPPPPPPLLFHAGVCPRGLGGLPWPIFSVRHDDVHSYKSRGGVRSDERTSGFYATNMNDAISAALYYLATRKERFVTGHHEHTSEPGCALAPVTEDVFNAVRSNASTMVWTDYHLLTKNCQDWAIEVTGGLVQ